MSEFKFACPVCGQHITANSDAAGSQLECPTCFRKIVVPQAPTSSDPKFILAATEANRPRPTQTGETRTASPSSTPQNPSIAFGLLLIVAACVVGALLFAFRGAIFGAGKTDISEIDSGPVTTNKLHWTLDLSKVEYPTNVASGRIRGRDFVCERATVQGGNLTLRHGRSGPPELGITIAFFSNQPEALAGKTISVTTNNTGSPRISVRWKEGDQPVTAVINDGYALRMEFGPVTASGMPGKIYLCLPDGDKSCVAGTFNAEIRRPSPRPPRRTSQPQR